MVQDRMILAKFMTVRVSAESSGDFTQKSFPAIFGGHLEFLRKMQKCVYLSMTLFQISPIIIYVLE